MQAQFTTPRCIPSHPVLPEVHAGRLVPARSTRRVPIDCLNRGMRVSCHRLCPNNDGELVPVATARGATNCTALNTSAESAGVAR